MSTVLSFWERPAGNALRWILLVPGALVSNVLVYFVANLFFNFGAWLSGEATHTPWITIITMAAAGGAFVVCGSLVAPPRGRRTASIVLTTVYCLLCLIGAFISFAQRNWGEMLGSCTSAVAAIVAAKSVHDEIS